MGRLIERNVHVYRRGWMVLVSGFFEPFYLLGLGFGLGTSSAMWAATIAVFVAPALMATAAMNGALYDSTYNMFYKLRYAGPTRPSCRPRWGWPMSRWARSPGR